MHFKRMTAFLSEKTVSSPIVIFSKLKNFRKVTIKVERAFLRRKNLWYAFYYKIATLTDFGKNQFLPQKPTFFKKKPKKNFGQVCKNCLLCVQRNISRKTSFFFKKRLYIFRLWADKFHESVLISDLHLNFSRFSSFSVIEFITLWDNTEPPRAVRPGRSFDFGYVYLSFVFAFQQWSIYPIPNLTKKWPCIFLPFLSAVIVDDEARRGKTTNFYRLVTFQRS